MQVHSRALLAAPIRLPAFEELKSQCGRQNQTIWVTSLRKKLQHSVEASVHLIAIPDGGSESPCAMPRANVECTSPWVLLISVFVRTVDEAIRVGEHSQERVDEFSFLFYSVWTYRGICYPRLFEGKICLAEDHAGHESLHISDEDLPCSV